MSLIINVIIVFFHFILLIGFANFKLQITEKKIKGKEIFGTSGKIVRR